MVVGESARLMQRIRYMKTLILILAFLSTASFAAKDFISDQEMAELDAQEARQIAQLRQNLDTYTEQQIGSNHRQEQALEKIEQNQAQALYQQRQAIQNQSDEAYIAHQHVVIEQQQRDAEAEVIQFRAKVDAEADKIINFGR